MQSAAHLILLVRILQSVQVLPQQGIQDQIPSLLLLQLRKNKILSDSALFVKHMIDL